MTLGVMLAATFSLTNCTEEIQSAPEMEKVPYTIYADAAETKTVNDGLSTKWYGGTETRQADEISVFFVESDNYWYSNNNKFIVTDAETGEFTTEELSGDLAAVNDWFALYPYTEDLLSPVNEDVEITVGGLVQSQKGFSSMKHIAGPNYPMWGIARGVESQELPYLRMTHLSSLVEVEVTNNSDDDIIIGGISLTAPEDIVGKYYVDFSTETPVYVKGTETSETVELHVSDRAPLAAGESAKFYFAIKPFTASSGFSLTLAVNGEEKEYLLENDVVFSYGKVKTMKYGYEVSQIAEVGPYTSNMVWTLSPEASYTESATINGQGDVKVLKLGKGTGNKRTEGYATITIPAGTTKIGFYALSWKGTDVNVALKQGDETIGVSYLYKNDGVTGNAPYTIDEEDAYCYHEIEVNATEEAEYTLTTTTDDHRVLIWGLNYYTEDGIGPDQNTEEPDEPVIPDADPVPATVAEVIANEVNPDVWYQITGTIKNIKNATYGNFDLEDETGTIYVYGLTATKVEKNDKSFASLGLKAGDIVTLIGTRADYNGTAQISGPAYYVRHEEGTEPEPEPEPEATEATVAEVLDANVDSNVWYQMTGTIQNIKNATYGNFDIVDETGSIYVYGLTATFVGSGSDNDKSFSSLNLREGDTVTIIGTRADYNGTAQVGGPAYYVSHISAPYVDFNPVSVAFPYSEWEEAVLAVTTNVDLSEVTFEFAGDDSAMFDFTQNGENITVTPVADNDSDAPYMAVLNALYEGEVIGSANISQAKQTTGDALVLTFSFKSVPDGWPNKTAGEAEGGTYKYTLDGVEYSFDLSQNVYCNSDYLMVKKKASVGLPVVSGYTLTKVVGQLNDSGTPSKKSQISITSDVAGADVVGGGEAQKWDAMGGYYTYNLSGTVAETMYYMYVDSSANSQFISVELTYSK